MKDKILIAFLFFLFIIPEGRAGLWLTESVVELEPFETKVVCVNIYQGVQIRSSHTVTLTENLQAFVEKVEPEEFYLEGLPCPGETYARRECLRKLCEEKNETYCQKVCITLRGPFDVLSCITDLFTENKSIPGCPFKWSPEYDEYVGGIRDLARAGRGSIGVAYDFKVFYRPYPLERLVIIATVVVVLIISVLIYKKRRQKSLLVYLDSEGVNSLGLSHSS